MSVPILMTDAFLRPNGDVNATFQAYVETPVTTWSIAGQLLVCSTNPAFLAAQVVTPADCRIIGIESNTAGVWGVFARGGGTYNGGSDTYYRADLNGTTLTLRKSVSGTLSTLATATVTRAAGAQLMLDCVGGTIQVWYGVAPAPMLISAVDAAIPGAAVGLAAGLWNGSTAQVQLTRVLACGDRLWAWGPPNAWTLTGEFRTDVVEYRGGDVQRNALWTRGRDKGAFEQHYLTDAQFAQIKSFFSQLRGQWFPFLLQDPTWTFLSAPQISQRAFAVADGVATLYKVSIDKAAAITTYTDGVVDSVQPIKSLITGAIQYTTPPYAGATLSFDATTPYWRVYFAADTLEWKRHVPNYWTVQANVIQDKDLLDGVPQ